MLAAVSAALPSSRAASISRSFSGPGWQSAADVDDPREAAGVGFHHPRLDVGRGHHHHGSVDVLEQPQRAPLVFHPVLQAHHRRPGRSSPPQRDQRASGVLALGGEQHHLGALPRNLRGQADRLDLQHRAARRVLQRQSALADRSEMRAPRDQRDRVPGLVQAGADDSADRPGAEHDEAHQSSGWRTIGRRAAAASSSRRTGVV
jgi:hypothetical protein